MTVWRIPQYGGRLLGHTQGTPTVPRGPSLHRTMCSAAMCAVPSSRSPMECVRLCSRIRGGSHPFYHTSSFTAGWSPVLSQPILWLVWSRIVCAHISTFLELIWDRQYNSSGYRSLVPTITYTHQYFGEQLISGELADLGHTC